MPPEGIIHAAEYYTEGGAPLVGGDEGLYRLGYPSGAQGAVLLGGHVAELLGGRDDLAADAVLLQLALDVLDPPGVGQDGVKLETKYSRAVEIGAFLMEMGQMRLVEGDLENLSVATEGLRSGERVREAVDEALRTARNR
jgi:hypothetical protein